jgi:hypothetical protein
VFVGVCRFKKWIAFYRAFFVVILSVALPNPISPCFVFFVLCFAMTTLFGSVYTTGEEISTAILPIIDLTNGLPTGCKGINARIETEFWNVIRRQLPNMTTTTSTTTGKGKRISDDASLRFPATALIAVGDLAAHTELLLDYGALPPSSFLVKYGCIPLPFLHEPQNLLVDSILLQYPPSLAPSPQDTARIQALERNSYPTTVSELEGFLTWLTPHDLQPLQRQLPVAPPSPESFFLLGGSPPLAPLNYIEPESLRMLRQYLILAKVGDDALVQTFLETSRIRGQINPKELGLCLIQIIDYNLSLLYRTGGNTGVNENNDGGTTNISNELEALHKDDHALTYIQRTCTIQRILYRDALAQWRHVLCRFYGLPSLVDQTGQSTSIAAAIRTLLPPPPPGLEPGEGCAVCGKTIPLKRCSQCKQVGYCCREHQRADWKFHKKACVVVPRS